jgi:histidyl-tRNA synthetase
VTDLITKCDFRFDVTLACVFSVNYYTGAIFEAAPPKEVSMGSNMRSCYDDLTGIFGLKT